MRAHSVGQGSRALRSDILTYFAIGIVAGALADITHEVLGHATVAWLIGDPLVSIETVAIQTEHSSRIVCAAGTSAQLIMGTLALAIFMRIRRSTNWALFLSMFAAFNLLNSGYLITAALTGFGDWAVVIGGLQPPWAWASLLVIVGATLYIGSILWIAWSMRRLVGFGNATVSDLRRLIVCAYLANGFIVTLASVFNPISPVLILIAGMGASLLLPVGILLLPWIVGRGVGTTPRTTAAETIARTSMSIPWIVAAIVVGTFYVAVFGPGIHFHT